MTLSYTLRLKVPHAEPDVYAQAVKWLENQGPGFAALEGSSGITYLNGVVYLRDISFKHDEDRLVFALKFPELV